MKNNDEKIVVNIIDPLNDELYIAELIKMGNSYKIMRINEKVKDTPELYLSPGWIDIHTHIYEGFTQISVNPNKVGLAKGVHVLADAGSAGEATLQGLKKYVLPQSDTQIKSWLNISSIGLVHLKEVSKINYLNMDLTLKAINENRDLICGVKVRSSGAIVEEMGIQPLKLAKLVAKEAKLPLMVHIGEAPPVIEDILELLEENDIITHCYHGKLGKPWLKDGTPIKALKDALNRGVKMDIGHGAASFSIDVCEKALSKGYFPTTISTDIHVRNINGPVYDLSTTMTKLLACGMSLKQVIKAVTLEPASVLNMQLWCEMDDFVNNATLFKLEKDIEEGGYQDAYGYTVKPIEKIVPVAVITSGEMKKLNY
ncbi:amidohydrolase/deacetylase family metallohydrolase [Sporosarcina psychrophila]|uniref:amidohydrolase/deacetylase family metallohydrolase n=1 Tax=Sporosarcina psychrophila TaxID=1476 RepID=UPI00078D2634|nr:amidohydrolase/deacetylase family metallohydrolase [Sporosarcina psychrophila]AMQ07707.1 hypothetical protein AZE41_18160 [Sporosarcina psychrophila]